MNFILSFPSSEVKKGILEVVREVMKLQDGVKFEVCFDCTDDSSVPAMGLELAVQNGRHRIN